ncbi:MAG: helicase-related protein, partial [Bowdeniella nasicola]|nr:helicase-related protein [Bowdeniella nasicola]
LRKTPMPTISNDLSVSTQMLADKMEYQRKAVAQALNPELIRPRILIADAVGLGKTLEIGMILSELVARGRGDNILIVTPRHVLEQMQHEMWCRFALPFVRLDSVGIQRIRRTIPATRNPFTYFKRAIISIDTLKMPRYREHLRRRHWDAVVIDESHNVTNTGTYNNELARILAPRTDALILASATPHNGNPKSFAELLRLLDPTVVGADDTIDEEAARDLIVRRHRYSEEVANEVGSDWAERAEPINLLVPASAEENAVAEELADTWLYPTDPIPGTPRLFGWTLAKAFLSSPAALQETVAERIKRLEKNDNGDHQRELAALQRLQELAEAAAGQPSAKLDKLVEFLKSKGVGGDSDTRAVVFSERIATLKYLQAALPKRLKLKKHNIGMLYGGLSDVEQQEVVEDFKRGNSDLRVLVTGDVASEGVNLHSECHLLVHFDIPWSLIRIEQRNGRIDRYGQRQTPEIATLLLQPDGEQFAGDVRVLTRLVEREHEAHQILPDVASIMGKNSVEAEEKAIAEMLASSQDLDAVAPLDGGDFFDELLAITPGEAPAPAADGGKTVVALPSNLFNSTLDYLSEALTEAFGDPYDKIAWRYDADHNIATLCPPEDLQKRLAFLPQEYLRERGVTEELRLATSKAAGEKSLAHARRDEDTNWPAAHYLGPLHPVLDWAADRALAEMSHNEVLAVRGNVDAPTFLLLGTISNQRGQLLNRTFFSTEGGFPSAIENISSYLRLRGLTPDAANPGAVPTDGLNDQLVNAISQAEVYLSGWVSKMLDQRGHTMLDEWLKRADKWDEEAAKVTQRQEVRNRRERVQAEQELARQMKPGQPIVRPLLVVLPQDTPVAEDAHV